jgi:hypothetical protein
MPEHGEFDPLSQKWFCSYWMSQDEWEDVHDYAPPSSSSDSVVFAETEHKAEGDEIEQEQDEEGEEG